MHELGKLNNKENWIFNSVSLYFHYLQQIYTYSISLHHYLLFIHHYHYHEQYALF